MRKRREYVLMIMINHKNLNCVRSEGNIGKGRRKRNQWAERSQKDNLI